MFIETIKVEGLANSSYVVGSEQSGRCAVIDPVRDIDQHVSYKSGPDCRTGCSNPISSGIEQHKGCDSAEAGRAGLRDSGQYGIPV